ncbi:MAG: hypothetical protein R2818_09980 [Flavobacteriales bacterium]
MLKRSRWIGPTRHQSCNDGNSNTINGVSSSSCQCVGTLTNFDCEGVSGGSSLPGTPCDDGNASTGNDLYQSDCSCEASNYRLLGRSAGGSGSTRHQHCDDGNNTINDT